VFDDGCSRVWTLSIPNLKEESECFVLLPDGQCHDEVIFEALQEQHCPTHNKVKHVPPSLETRNLIQKDLSHKPSLCFLGHKIDMFTMIDKLLTLWLVSIVGKKDNVSGIGCNSLLHALCDYINERPNIFSCNIVKIYFVEVEVRKFGQDNAFLNTLNQLLQLLKIPEVKMLRRKFKKLLKIFA